MKERQLKVLIIFGVLSAVLLSYQNCGSKNSSLDATAKVITSDDGEMDIIDANITGQINFAESKVVLDSNDVELKAAGICSAEQDGGLLSWKVYDEADDVIAEGKALCDNGTFEVVIADADAIACDAELSLKANFGAKAKAQIAVSKKCN